MITMHDKTYRKKLERIKFLEEMNKIYSDEIIEYQQQIKDLQSIIGYQKSVIKGLNMLEIKTNEYEVKLWLYKYLLLYY